MRLLSIAASTAAVAALATLAVLQALRLSDQAAATRAWQRLAGAPQPGAARFDPSMLAGLPEPARRFFAYAIRPGAKLATTVEITMEGELSLGTQQDPGYQPMHARQLLAAPRGFVWQVQAGRGLMRMSGSDGMEGGRSWTRFWLLGTVPVARAGDGMDHLRSSFGRAVAEAVFWSPAALLPRDGVHWEAVDADTARAVVTHEGQRQELLLHVDTTGRPLWVSMPRWTNANPEGVFRLQPFGGHLSDFREVQGYRLPFRVDGGNFFGTADYFPFYRARVREVRMRE